MSLESLKETTSEAGRNVITNRAGRWSKLALLAAGIFALAGATISPSYAASGTAIFIVQGLPGKDLDVVIDKDPPVAQDVKLGSAAGPFPVTPGSHMVTFSENGTEVLTSSFMIKAGSTIDLVPHLLASAASAPKVMVYNKYDAVTVTKDKALFVVTHAAAAPPVDIRVNNERLFRNIANRQSSKQRVTGGTYTVSVVPVGKTEPIHYGPVKLEVKGGTIVHLYVVGDLNKRTLTIAPQILPATVTGSKKPSEVDTGTGGQALGHGPILEVNLAR